MPAHEKLKVWRKSHLFAVEVLRATDSGACAAYSGTVDQIRRVAITIPLSIAEGSAQPTGPRFSDFLEVAMVSARETRYLVTLLMELGAIETTRQAVLEARCDEISQMLAGLIRHVTGKSRRARTTNSIAATGRVARTPRSATRPKGGVGACG